MARRRLDVSTDERAVTLRPALEGDAPSVARIWHVGWRDGHLGHVPDELTAIRTEDSFFERAVQHIDRTTVACIDDEVVGFVMVVDDEVEQVYVDAASRGSGVASVLLAEAERLVSASGHRKAWLAVVAGNTRARRFYERSGWSDEGPMDHAAPTDGAPVMVPALCYTKGVG